MHSSAALRQKFIDYFASRDHQVVPGSPLVPADDQTLLFTNAGMVQFKDVFLGRDKRDYRRAVTAQRCVRAGGKHNDLENVGYTARHHTFFEMLGNFSFGDYFKQDAIRYAWEFLTAELGLAAGRLWVTVHESDDDAYRIWTGEIGIPKSRIVRVGDKPDGSSDNFWQMGDTGPCGPCTEIFWDHGEDHAGEPPGSGNEGDRYVEIWNLVFMQFDRGQDGTLTPLPKPSVDTGMGLERLAAVMQAVHSNYDTDILHALVDAAAQVAGVEDTDDSSLRVIADHIRACAFLVVDGVTPSNEGRGYVLRRIIRRAVRHGYRLGIEPPFFHLLVAPLEDKMGDAYPELRKARKRVERVLKDEERRFAETLSQGMAILDEVIETTRGGIIAGDIVFKLYDTYGFPVDLTADIARERGLTLDTTGFEHAMNAQRERGRASSRFGADRQDIVVDAQTDFTGYDHVDGKGKVLALFKDGEPTGSLEAGDAGTVVLDHTPFYGESGGQVGDTGTLRAGKSTFSVMDTHKQGPAHLHIGTMDAGKLRVGDEVEASIDAARRAAIVLNHSATHLLHAALRGVLGEHVQQKGSLVAPDRLRFDFSHDAPLTREEISRIEGMVNAVIRRNEAADIRLMSFDDAMQAGAIALFGEKYGDEVRVLRLGGDFSVELCGGTHVRRTGDIGFFKIVSETGISSGVRRVEAVTGEGALEWVADQEALIQRIGAKLKSGRDGLDERLGQVIERVRTLERELDNLRSQLAGGKGSDIAERAVEIAGKRVLAARLEGADTKALRTAVDRLKDKLAPVVIVLAAVEGGKVRLAAGVTDDCVDRIPAGELVNHVAMQVGGKGGGRGDFAQAGGTDPAALDAALASVHDWVAERLKG